jgi:rfaE bifunctional protein nucleotidyltransferase chain/domain
MNDRCYEWTITGSKPISEFEKKLNAYRAQGKTIVTANGCFDLLHFGHLSLLMGAKSLGDILIVGVNSDRIVKKIKGADRPVFLEKERASLLVSLEYVDHVIVYDDILPNDLLGRIRPDTHCISGEYAQKKLPEKAIVEISGGKIEVLPFIPGYSTTNIIQKIDRHQIDPGAQASPSKGKDAITDYLFESSNHIRCLAYQHGDTLTRIAGQMANVIKSNKKIIFCGDVGSDADAQRFATELNRRFSPGSKRLPATSVSSNHSVISDIDNDDVFSRPLKAGGKPGDLLIILTANGNSKAIVMAGETAREIGMQVFGFTSNPDSPLHSLCEEILSIDSQKTTMIQQGFFTAFNGIYSLLEQLLQGER